MIRNSAGRQLRWLHADRLGSIETISDESGAVKEVESFDAFGAPRDKTWQDNGRLLASTVTTRGFTTHEHLDEHGLIHMNGRAYDPGLGRFLSVDPFVQDIANSQNLNPYSYILNNPLSGTDPTGYSPEQELKNAQKGPRTLMQAIAGVGSGSEIIFNGAGCLADAMAFLAGNKAPQDLGSPQGEESRMRFVESPLGDVTKKLTESVFTEGHLQLGLLTGVVGPVSVPSRHRPSPLPNPPASGFSRISSRSTFRWERWRASAASPARWVRSEQESRAPSEPSKARRPPR